MKTVIVSGGFDPVHVGHIRLFKQAKKLGDRVIVILNNDNWLRVKKGFVFMPEKDRKEILESIRYIDRVFMSFHKPNTKDMSVTKELISIVLFYPADELIFANGGDRKQGNIPEVDVCNCFGIKMVFNVGGKKIESSSNLLERAEGKKRRIIIDGKI